MLNNRPKFSPGQIVRYILSPLRPMIVVINKTKIELLDSLNARTVLTGKVVCSWAGQNGDRMEDTFSEEELELNNMWEDKFQLDSISIFNKKSGVRTSKIKANFESSKISFTPADSIIIEPGDQITRYLDETRIEIYDVIDADFKKAWPPHFQSSYTVHVKKVGLPIDSKNRSGDIINIYGDNSRFNKESTDNSVNIIHHNNDRIKEQIKALQIEIEKLNLSSQDREEALELIQALDEQISMQKPKLSLIKTIIGNISKHGAEISSIGAFIWQLLHQDS